MTLPELEALSDDSPCDSCLAGGICDAPDAPLDHLDAEDDLDSDGWPGASITPFEQP